MKVQAVMLDGHFEMEWFLKSPSRNAGRTFRVKEALEKSKQRSRMDI
ncbi:hypothetical protein V7122_12360 [Bacillus sp. JJ1532]